MFWDARGAMLSSFFPDSGWFSWPVAVFAACAALAGWWCAGFAWRCCRLLRVWQTGVPVFAAMDPGAAVLAALCGPAAKEPCIGGGPPPAQALFISAISAASAFALASRYGISLIGAASALAVLVLLALAVIDAHTGILPDALTLPLLWLGLALAWAGSAIGLHDAVAGAILGYGLLYVLFLGFKAWRGREGMGYGDFKLAAALGAWVGPLPLAYILLAASLLGTVYALLRWKAQGLSAGYPFGPFLAAAGILVLARFTELHLGF